VSFCATRHDDTVVPTVEEEEGRSWPDLAARQRRRKRDEFEVEGSAGRHSAEAEGVSCLSVRKVVPTLTSNER
jgi:hypothetical protein